MRQVVTRLVGCLALLLVLLGTSGGAEAQVITTCDPGNVYEVDTQAEADAIGAAGYSNADCKLTIKNVNMSITIQKLTINAGEILILSSQLINNLGGSEIIISTPNTAAQNGNITIDKSSIKAHKVLRFTCIKPGCAFTATKSELIAATDFANPDEGGGLFFNIRGPINIQTTTIHGGDTLEMRSVTSSITLICGGTPFDCKDPLVAPIPAIILAACGNPPVFPCNVNFPDADSLTAVCIQAPGVQCNGGHKEKRFTAGTFIDFTGSTITADEHVTFTCGTAVPSQGDLKASGATFIMDSLVINCPGKVDISNSTIDMTHHLTISSGSTCPVPSPVGDPCVNASGAKITAKPMTITAHSGQSTIDVCGGTFIVVPGVGFPKLNNDTAPSYDNNVLDTDAECGGAGTGGKFQNDNGCTTCSTTGTCSTSPGVCP